MSALENMKAGVCAYEDGQPNKALSLFEKACVEAESSADESDHLYNILLWLGTVNLDLWFVKAAEDQAERAARLRFKSVQGCEAGTFDLEFLFARLKAKRRLFTEAEGLAQALLAHRVDSYGSGTVQVACALQQVGMIFLEAGKFTEAESALRRAMLIRENKLGNENLAYAESLDALSSVYAAQNEIVRAKTYCKLALKIREKHLPANHLLIGYSLNHLAILTLMGFRVPEAETMWRRALSIAENQLPPNHPAICAILNGLASALVADFRYAAAQDLYERALTAAESAYPQRVVDLYTAVSGLGRAYVADSQFDKAEPLIRRSLAMLRQDHELQFTGERGMIENLISTQVYQGKIIDAIGLFPDQMRAKHTSEFTALLKKVEQVADFVQKNILPQDVPVEKVNKKTEGDS